MLPVNCGSHADYQNFVTDNLRKYYPNPDALAPSTWDIIERFWSLDLSDTDELMRDKYSKFCLLYTSGFAIAKAMAGAGATIVFNDIKQELVDKGLAAYEAEGIKAHGYVCDVTDEEAVNALVAQIEKEVGVIDILVNNAGIIKMCIRDRY